MSLTDLKRDKKKPQRQSVSVEAFIEGANHYAAGQVSAPRETKGPDKRRSTRYRHATFTLTQEVIDRLSQLSNDTKLAKSKLIRILINEFSELSQQEISRIARKYHD